MTPGFIEASSGSDQHHVNVAYLGPFASQSQMGNAHSIVSVDSILQDKPDTSPAVQGTPNAAQSRTTNMASQVIELSGTRTWMSTSTCPWTGTADGLFVRHPKYFFKDGNVTFLVRVFRPCKWYEVEFIY